MRMGWKRKKKRAKFIKKKFKEIKIDKMSLMSK